MSEIQGVERWGFEALFQRFLSKERVSSMVDNYLKQRSRFRFFPPVTLALLPTSQDALQHNYRDEQFEVSKEGPLVVWKLNGLEIKFHAPSGTPNSSNQLAFIRWDATLFNAVAIDGQHRISALKQYLSSDDPQSNSADTPATILVFDPILPKGKHLLNLTREIFVDVNHNAKIVDESRIILLDDRDLVRKASRECIIQTFDGGLDATPLQFFELEAGLGFDVLPGIPQEMIDVTLGKQGADVSKLREWQYASVFNLYRILRHFIFQDQWTEFEKQMGTSHLQSSNGELGAAIATRREELDAEIEDGEQPFAEEDAFKFSPLVVQSLLENHFKRNVQPLILGVFTGFAPYRQMLERASAIFSQPEGPQLREFLIAESTAGRNQRSPFSERLQTTQPEIHARLLSLQRQISRPSDWDEDLSWYSVTQRALFFESDMVRKAIEYYLPDEATRSSLSFVKFYVEALNGLWARGVFKKDFQITSVPAWFGSALDLREGEYVIKPSDAAAKRMGQLIRIMVAAWYAKEKGYEGNNFFNEAASQNATALKAAITAIKKCFQKYLKNKDMLSTGRSRQLEYYEKSAETRLKNVIKRTVFEFEEPEEETQEDDLI
jgi:hypothetical protein